MKYDTDIHHRRSIRLKDYDYSQAGAYFVTICTQNRECLFGEIINGEMVLNEYGKIVYNEWIKLPGCNPYIELDVFQIMPNHIHGIISVGATLAVALNKSIVQNNNSGVNNSGTDYARAGASPAPTIKTITVGNIVGSYKSSVANGCLKIFKSKNEYMGKLWQRNYYEHIIRNETETNKIREYIINNPLNWETDENYKG